MVRRGAQSADDEQSGVGGRPRRRHLCPAARRRRPCAADGQGAAAAARTTSGFARRAATKRRRPCASSRAARKKEPRSSSSIRSPSRRTGRLLFSLYSSTIRSDRSRRHRLAAERRRRARARAARDRAALREEVARKWNCRCGSRWRSRRSASSSCGADRESAITCGGCTFRFAAKRTIRTMTAKRSAPERRGGDRDRRRKFPTSSPPRPNAPIRSVFGAADGETRRGDARRAYRADDRLRQIRVAARGDAALHRRADRRSRPGRRASPALEARWLNLFGFCFRPGFGAAEGSMADRRSAEDLRGGPRVRRRDSESRRVAGALAAASPVVSPPASSASSRSALIGRAGSRRQKAVAVEPADRARELASARQPRAARRTRAAREGRRRTAAPPAPRCRQRQPALGNRTGSARGRRYTVR